MSNADFQEILDFWFEGVQSPPYDIAQTNKRWFGSGESLDALLSERFGTLLHEAEVGNLDYWCETAPGSLALVILLDQFSRNIYRGSGKAFANDDMALNLAKQALEQGFDQALPPMQRIFFYLPFEHSENLKDQEKSLELFWALKDQSSDDLKNTFSNYYDYAARHHNVIAKFGRFPHRNKRLGRDSTIEELEFLNLPNSSFG